MGTVVLDEVTFFFVVAAFLLFDVLLFVLLIIGDVVPTLLFEGDAPNVNDVADPLLFVGSADVVDGLLMFNLEESKENAGDGCLDESKEKTAGCLDSSFDLLLEAAVLLVTLLLFSFDDAILIGSILYLYKGKYILVMSVQRRCTLCEV